MFAHIVVGGKESILESARKVHLLGILTLGVGKGAYHPGHGIGQPRTRLQRLRHLLLRQVAQSVVCRAAAACGGYILAVVISVEQAYGLRIAARQLLEDLTHDLRGVETLGVGVKRILPQAGYQTVIILLEHGRQALNSKSETFSRR